MVRKGTISKFIDYYKKKLYNIYQMYKTLMCPQSLVHCLANAVILKQATEKGYILILTLNKSRSDWCLQNRKITIKHQAQQA